MNEACTQLTTESSPETGALARVESRLNTVTSVLALPDRSAWTLEARSRTGLPDGMVYLVYLACTVPQIRAGTSKTRPEQGFS